MNTFKNIKYLIEKILSDPRVELLAESKHATELLKVLPIFGSWLEAISFGSIRDKKLNKRLIELENTFDNVLTFDDGEQILDLVQQNRNLVWHFISHFQDEIFKQNEKLRIELKKTLYIPKKGNHIIDINTNFHFVIISGASATGKDSILNKLIEHNYKGFRKNEVLKKYTTRKKRKIDSQYYKFKTQKQFERLFENDEIIFPFKKREHKYGFSKLQLAEAIEGNNLLFCIYTEFDSLLNAKKQLSELGIPTTFILLEAKFDELKDRSWGRNFDITELTSRINSIERDLRYIEKNNELIKDIFDFRIYSGDDKSKNDLIREVIMNIEKNTINQIKE